MDISLNLKKEIPTVDKIIDETWKSVNPSLQDVEENFGNFLLKFDLEATNIFKRYERKILRRLAEKWIENQKEEIKEKFRKILRQPDWKSFIEEASKLFEEFGILVQNLEKILGNMRKARGGKTFEKVVAKALNFIGVSCEIPKGKASKKLRRIDIVIPSVGVALRTPDKAIFLTCKRTLRERWKQEVPSAGPNRRVYLITIDEELSENKAREINEKGLIAFVRDELKESKFKNFHCIRKLSDLPREVGKL
ncbi:type II restriction endonuclease [Candidatus Chrysopegis kryptomonas]|jgi:hypothetical protein|uniref:EcoRII C terminal n=1 Tax=Candidatus Chryseopegocella kryptomonas TaxID=1633643 RepID=A0A0P1MNS7_9BACT|nr:type II restriction endonuclease [Candidatus Chrysopegis kryptomonas]CUS97250.1 EcoRII C terminal [Candidatus Chrysopegis kryptomonas]